MGATELRKPKKEEKIQKLVFHVTIHLNIFLVELTYCESVGPGSLLKSGPGHPLERSLFTDRRLGVGDSALCWTLLESQHYTISMCISC